MDAAGRFAVLIAALILDRLAGDPPAVWSRIPHPVATAGRLIAQLDRRWNDEALSEAARRRRGVAVILLLVGGSLATGWALHRLFAALPYGFLLEIVAVAVLLAQGSLLAHVRHVGEALTAADLESARHTVAAIVGRDVSRLDEGGVTRAAIESLAENFSDGVVAPAFWYALLGLPGLLAYKAVNTADSMIGHRTARHAAFGWAAARLDDALNLVPARLSVLLIALAALPRNSTGNTLRVARRDAPRHASPNAGRPEAAAAGALGLALGGPRTYAGRAVAGAWLNADGRRDADAADVRRALRLAETAWAILLALVVICLAVAR